MGTLRKIKHSNKEALRGKFGRGYYFRLNGMGRVLIELNKQDLGH